MTTITQADIKLLASARMTDLADGGGPMSSTALQDGADNNVFPDIATLDRARGAVTLRKVYAAVLNDGTDALLGAHAIADTPPADANTFGLLVAGSGQGQTLGQLAASLDSGSKFAGAARLTAVAAASSISLTVSGITSPLIPKASAVSVTSGALPTTKVRGYVDTGKTVALVVTVNSTRSSINPSVSQGAAVVMAGSISGSVTMGGVSYSVTSNAEADTVTLTPGAGSPFVFSRVPGENRWTLASDVGFSTASTMTGAVSLVTSLPEQSVAATVTNADQALYSIALPAGTVRGSETITFTADGAATPFSISNFNGLGRESFNGTASTLLLATFGWLTSATLDRATGVLTLVFNTRLKAGSQIRVGYAAGGATAGIASGPATLDGSGQATVSLTGGYRVASLTFTAGSTSCSAQDGLIKAGGTVVGTVTDAGLISLPTMPGAAITLWYGTQALVAAPVSSISAALPLGATSVTVSGTTAAGAAFTSTANSAGVFGSGGVAGTYTSATGTAALTFAAPVRFETLAYSISTPVSSSSAADLNGLIEGNFGVDGRVPIFALNDVVVLRHTASAVVATPTNGATVNAGRTNLAGFRVVGADGVAITAGYSVNLAAGTLLWTATAGYATPVTVYNSIEHVAAVAGLPAADNVLLNQPLTRDFPVGSVLSSALVLDTLQASAGDDFSQATWTGVWSDTRVGDAITPQYDQLAHPILVKNNGAITDRWALIFTTTSAFRVVSESLGQIATGDIYSALAPVNPATGRPYFTLAPEGWGLGWSNGNVLRFNTRGANAPVWAIRVIQPSAVTTGSDSMTLAARGDINT